MSYSSLLIHTCDVLDRTFDWKGRATEAVTPKVKCRIEHKARIVKVSGANGVVDVQSPTTVFFKLSAAIKPEARLRFEGREHGILEIQKPANSVADHHIEVLTD